MAFTLYNSYGMWVTNMEEQYFEYLNGTVPAYNVLFRADVYYEQNLTQNYTNYYVELIATSEKQYEGTRLEIGFFDISNNMYLQVGSTKYYPTQYDGWLICNNGNIYEQCVIKSGTFRVKHSVSGGCPDISFGVNLEFHPNAYFYNDDGELTYFSSITHMGSIEGSTRTIRFPTINRMPKILTAANFTDLEYPSFTYEIAGGTSDAVALKGWISKDTAYMDAVTEQDIPMNGVSHIYELSPEQMDYYISQVQGSNSMGIIYYLLLTRRDEYGEEHNLLTQVNRTFTVVGANPILNSVVKITDNTSKTLTGNDETIIKYFSDVEYWINAVGNKGSTIRSQRVTCGNKSNTSATGTLSDVESNRFVFTCTDSRGNVGSRVIEKSFVDYIKVTCNIDNTLPDTDGNFNFSVYGNYFNQSFGAVQNTLSVEYQYKTEGGEYSEWKPMTVTANDDNTYTADVSIQGLDYQTKYIFHARATDKLMSVISSEKPIKTTPVFDWSGSDFNFNVPVTINGDLTVTGTINNESGSSGGSTGNDIEGDCNITGNLRLKGSGNYGNYLYFGDGSYAYIGELTDDALTIKATTLKLNASSGVYVNDSLLPTFATGRWTPSLSSSAISSYTTQEGGYLKIGQNVTIWFNIKANCYSGYNSTNIVIGGCPYTPMWSASGGGMCSGAYVSAGFNFQCWSISTEGDISARVQSCNNTSAANISTSASGCFYRSSGGEITLSGSITFMANS